MALILASTSESRRELLGRLQIPFDCANPGVDEAAWKERPLTPSQLAQELALAKARAIVDRFPGADVLGGDQVCECDGQLFGKPGTEAAAVDQLRQLAGKTHRLWTAVCLIHRDAPWQMITTTALTMRPLSDEEIHRYVRHDQPLFCAGSYKIESLGIALFERIETPDSTAIMGLPLMALAQQLRVCGYSIP